MRTKRWGRFIVVSGFDGFWGQVTHRAHNLAAKAGLHGLAKAIGREFGSDGITSNTVAPGAIDTVRDWSQYVHQTREKILLKFRCSVSATSTRSPAPACFSPAAPAGLSPGR
jgi:3-oxoacyl-[acyl-carrier protein] reductase